MKKLKFFALLIAIAFTSAVGLTACSSSDETAADVNPTYDGTSVRTDFAFNITKASQATTRMSGENTQENGSFLGMEHMYLFPFRGVPADNMASHINNGVAAIQKKNFALGELTTSEISTSSSRKIYSLSLPIGTDNFLFYGKAIRGSKTGFDAGRLSSSFFDSDNNKIYSSTLVTGADDIGNTNDINFNLVGIASSLGDDATNLAGYLTQIAQTEGWADAMDIVSNPALHSEITNPGAYSSLADLYSKFTYISSDRCGSAEAITRMVLDLFRSARAINQESSVSEVKTIAAAICTNIDKYYNSTVRVTVGASDPDPEKWAASVTGVSATFPDNLDLPMGAAQLTYDSSTKTFSYKTGVSQGASLFTSGIDYRNICYPAELVYFDNSPLRATDKYKKESDFPDTPSAWDFLGDAETTAATGFNADWSGTEVASSTRAVAMKNNVNYGVALLESTVKLGADNLTDNKATILGGSATNQDDIPGTEMQVTGIIIGGQPGSVGWKMVNKTTTFDHVIYDKSVQYEATLPSSTSTASATKNFTVVLDNLTSASTQSDVNFALQIKNGSKDFYGKNGLIPAGHTFYLVGKLSLSDIATARTIPDVTLGSGNTVKRNLSTSGYRITEESNGRVFIQDYKTKANITISANSLQKAYSCVPDLRSTEVLFGLSVDLTWETGLTFSVNM